MSGVYNFDEFSWAGYFPGLQEDERIAFGHSEENDKLVIIFETNDENNNDVPDDQEVGSDGTSSGDDGGECFIYSIYF